VLIHGEKAQLQQQAEVAETPEQFYERTGYRSPLERKYRLETDTSVNLMRLFPDPVTRRRIREEQYIACGLGILPADPAFDDRSTEQRMADAEEALKQNEANEHKAAEEEEKEQEEVKEEKQKKTKKRKRDADEVEMKEDDRAAAAIKKHPSKRQRSRRQADQEERKTKTPKQYIAEWQALKRYTPANARQFGKYALQLLTNYTREQRLDTGFMEPILEPDRKRRTHNAKFGGYLLCAYNFIRDQMLKGLCAI
jgi:flagellar biosynthesis GTPase FlhF